MTDQQEIEIERLANGGSGVGRLGNGRVCFVPYTCPGDHVRIHNIKHKKRFAEAALLEITRPAAIRTQAPCALHGRCGGCDLQHINYAAQLQLKQAICQDHLRRFLNQALTLDTIQASPRPWRYRTRVKLHYDGTRLGYYARRSQNVLPISECHIAAMPIVAALPNIAEWCQSYLRQAAEIEVRVSDDDSINVRLLTQERIYAADLQALLSTAIVGVSIGQLSIGDSRQYYNVCGLRLHASAGVFTQANASVNQLIAERLLRWAGDKPLRILDLYCGQGNFSLPLAAAGHCLLGIEGHHLAIADAQANAKRLGLAAQATFNCGDLSRAEYIKKLPPCDLLLLDPPRTGASQIETIAQLGAGRVAYVSCDLATLTRDLNRLIAFGYAVESIQAFDMFSQTGHIELVACLSRR